MAKHAFRKLVPTVVGIGILLPTTYFAYDGYVKSAAPSNFEVAAARLTPTVVKDSILAIGVTKVYHHGFDN
jgi:hypothetical protein